MDPDYYVIDPEGDIFLCVDEHLNRLHLGVFRTDTNPSSSLTLISNGSPPAEDAHAITLAPDASEMKLDPSTLPSLQNCDEMRVPKLRVLISSKHLTLVSKFFRAKLDAMLDLGESDVLPSCANDTSALLVLLDVLHCQTRKVPRFLTRKMLFTVAVLANHYGCVEAVEAFSEVWIGNLGLEVPMKWTEDLAEWIFIAWIFRDQRLFNWMTWIAVRENTRPMACLSMQMIPDRLLQTIEKARQDSIDYILQELYQRLASVDHHGCCCDDCDRLIVGTLLRQLQLHQLYPRPVAPFHGITVAQLLQCLTFLPEPRCNALIHPANGCASNCVLLPEVDHGFFHILDSIMGMTVTEFPLKGE